MPCAATLPPDFCRVTCNGANLPLVLPCRLLEGGAAAGMAPELVAKVGSLVQQVGAAGALLCGWRLFGLAGGWIDGHTAPLHV